MNRTKWKILICILVVFFAVPCMGLVNKQGGESMETKYVKDANRTLWKDITVNGSTGAGTSTTYNLGSNNDFGFGYDIDQGTSTPHIRIEWFEGIGEDAENIDWEVLPSGTLTASDETVLTPQVVTFFPDTTLWIRFEYEGLAGNATNTTFSAWFTRQ